MRACVVPPPPASPRGRSARRVRLAAVECAGADAVTVVGATEGQGTEARALVHHRRILVCRLCPVLLTVAWCGAMAMALFHWGARPWARRSGALVRRRSGPSSRCRGLRVLRIQDDSRGVPPLLAAPRTHTRSPSQRTPPLHARTLAHPPSAHRAHTPHPPTQHLHMRTRTHSAHAHAQGGKLEGLPCRRCAPGVVCESVDCGARSPC